MFSCSPTLTRSRNCLLSRALSVSLSVLLLAFVLARAHRVLPFYRCSFVSRLSDRAHVCCFRRFVCVCSFLCVVINFLYLLRLRLRFSYVVYCTIFVCRRRLYSVVYNLRARYFNSTRCCHLYSLPLPLFLNNNSKYNNNNNNWKRFQCRLHFCVRVFVSVRAKSNENYTKLFHKRIFLHRK